MTIETINVAASILSGVKLNKIKDKKVKSALLKNYLLLRKVAKEANEDKNEIIRKFQEDWREEIADVESYRRENKQVVGHDEYLDAERDANKAISDILSLDVELELSPIRMDDTSELFEDITLEQVAFLQEVGLIEE